MYYVLCQMSYVLGLVSDVWDIYDVWYHVSYARRLMCDMYDIWSETVDLLRQMSDIWCQTADV